MPPAAITSTLKPGSTLAVLNTAPTPHKCAQSVTHLRHLPHKFKKVLFTVSLAAPRPILSPPITTGLRNSKGNAYVAAFVVAKLQCSSQ